MRERTQSWVGCEVGMDLGGVRGESKYDQTNCMNFPELVKILSL